MTPVIKIPAAMGAIRKGKHPIFVEIIHAAFIVPVLPPLHRQWCCCVYVVDTVVGIGKESQSMAKMMSYRSYDETSSAKPGKYILEPLRRNGKGIQSIPPEEGEVKIGAIITDDAIAENAFSRVFGIILEEMDPVQFMKLDK